MKKTVFIFTGLYLLLYIMPLGVRPLFIPDEVRYFEIPREMIASGDWVVPRLNGLRYFEKPVFGYWFNALSISVFGENAFAVRFSSAFSVGISALAVFFLSRRFSGSRSVGILSTAILMTSLLVIGVGTFAVLDSMLSMLLTLAMTTSLYAYNGENGTKTNRLLLFSAGGLCGLAFLTKGFLAFAVPVLVVVPFMALDRRFKTLLSTAWIPVAGALLISLPWSLLIHFREGDFWRYFIWVEHINRFFSPHGGQHPEPFWFYIPLLFVAALPWSTLWPAAVRGLLDMGHSSVLVRFSACWLLFPFLFFSASSGKLLTYLLPCLPPLSILTALGLLRYFQMGKHRLYTLGVSFLGTVAVVVALLVAMNQATGFAGIQPFGANETWKWISVCTGLCLWAAITFASTRAKTVAGSLGVFAGAPLLLILMANFVIPEMTLEQKAPGNFLKRIADEITPETTIVSTGGLVRATSSFFKRDDIYLFRDQSEVKYGLSFEDAKHRFLDAASLKQLIERNAAGGEHIKSKTSSVILIEKADDLYTFIKMLPRPTDMDRYGNFLLIKF